MRGFSAPILFAAGAGLTLLTACDSSSNAPPPPPAAKELTIITPHSEAIRETFTEGFWNWHIAKRGAPVRIRWIYRGTPQCVEYVRAGLGATEAESRYTSADLMFGGGVTDHARLAAESLSRTVDVGDACAGVPAEILGNPTRDPNNRWFATGLSSFGLLFNERACQERGIAPPAAWTDLAEPRFFGWFALADPQASGSHRECLLLVLQQAGWDAGWAAIVRTVANARALNSRSGDAIKQVETGVSLATYAVNSDGMAAAAQSEALRYLDPPGGTTVSPDLVSVLTTAKDVELAKDFVRYVLSDEGQALWAVKRGDKRPYGETLYHFAIKPTTYEQYAGSLAVASNPLKADFGLRVEPTSAAWQEALLRPLIQALCGKGNHVRLQQAWRSILDAGAPAPAVAELTRPWFDAPQGADFARQITESPAAADKLIEEWTRAFADRCTRAAALAAPGAPRTAAAR